MKVLDGRIYRFEDVEVDPSRRCLRRGGVELEVRQKSLRALLFLLEERHRLVTKEELIEHVWEGMAVTDDALVQLVKEIRRHLGDDPRRPHFIKTVPRGGYRFIAPVEEFFSDLPSTVEVERHTAIEIEFEEEIGADAEKAAATEARPITLSPATTPAPRRKMLTVVVAAVVLLAAGLLTAYLIKRSRPRAGEMAEVTLPQVAGKRALAVMYFENQSGDAELNWLREGLADMLITDLSRSQKLSVLGRGQLHLLLERIGHDSESNVRLDEALDVAHRIQAEIVLLGSFARLNGKIRVDVQLYDARAGNVLAAERIVADQPDQLLTQVDLLALKLLSHLGPDEQEIKTGLGGKMTNNLEAYRYYSLALEKAQGLQNAEAVALLEKSIALDPKFAMAHARIGYTYAVAWSFTDKAKPYLEKAFQLSDRLTEKDRLYITAWYSIANLDYPNAIKSFREIVAHYPLEIEAYARLARLLRGEGQQEEAIEVARQALAIDAGATELYNTLGTTYSELGRHAEAIAMFARYVALDPDEPNAHDSLGLGYQWAGRYAEAIAEYERALALNPKFDVAVVHLGNTYFQQGRYREAIAEYRRYIEVASSDAERGRGYDSIAMALWKKGELGEAEEVARKSLTYDESFMPPFFLVSIARGYLARAAKLKGQLLTKQPLADRGARRSSRELSFISGYFNLRSGHAAQAVEDFKEALQYRPPIWHIDAFEDCLANAYLELGRFDEAINEYERILSLNPAYPLAHYHLAQAYERNGKMDRARGEYERFLQIWETADMDIPEVQTARMKLKLQ